MTCAMIHVVNARSVYFLFHSVFPKILLIQIDFMFKIFFFSVQFQLAMSSYYEGEQDPDVDIDDDDVESSSTSQPPQAPTSLFGSSGDKSKRDAKNKGKNKYNASGARIVTLNNMASDDEEKDDGTGQVCTH